MAASNSVTCTSGLMAFIEKASLRLLAPNPLLLGVGLGFIVWLGTLGNIAEAASLKGVIKSLSKSLSKQSDEVAQRLGKLLDELSQHSDEALGRVGKQLHPPSATDELIAQLPKVGIHMTDELQAALRNLDDVSRGALVGLLEQSDPVAEAMGSVGPLPR